MPMPNRNDNGDYRYAYQGQEVDPETGKEAFQLRLYDSRIGRWLTTDPYRQYSSPYLGMGNNPVNGVDPDGGFWQELGNFIGGNGWNSNSALDFQANGGTLGEWVGNAFSGHRKGYNDNSAGSHIMQFNAVNDFASGFGSLNFNGNVGIGITNEFEADAAAIGGLGGNINKTSMMFLGGDYGGYWYDYVGFQVGGSHMLGYGASVAANGELQLALHNNLFEGTNLPNDPTSYQGIYGEGALYIGPEAGPFGGIKAGGSITFSGEWVTLGLGVDVSWGSAISIGDGTVQGGKTWLTTPNIIPTKDRILADVFINHLNHLILK